MTSISVPFYRKSSSGFRIINFILTFCRCSMVIFIYIYLLLRFLRKMYNNLHKKGLIGCPPKPHKFVSLSLNSGINPLFKVNHNPLKPSKVSSFQIKKYARLPTHTVLGNKLLPPINKSLSKPWKGTCPTNDWISLDSRYHKLIKARLDILSKYKNKVIGCQDISNDACRELFIYVIRYLAKKYPGILYFRHNKGIYWIYNKSIYKRYIVDISKENGFKLLTILSECVPIDYTILHKVNGVYIVIASNSLFSINWLVSDRLGFDLIKLHGKAPGWQKPGDIYHDKYVGFFDNFINSNKIVKRTNIFVVNTPELLLPSYKPKVPLTSEIGNAVGYRLKDLYLRRELQTFHLLPISGFIVFGVQTFIQRLDMLTYSELLDLKEYVSGWGTHTANYHVRDSWLPVIVKYLEDHEKTK